MRLWRWLLSTVRTFYGQHVQGTNWLKNNVPENEAVATNDVGAISYLSGREIVDLRGIIKPEILNIICSPIEEGKRRDFLRAYLLKRNVRYLAIYGDWFSWIVEDSRLQKMF